MSDRDPGDQPRDKASSFEGGQVIYGFQQGQRNEQHNYFALSITVPSGGPREAADAVVRGPVRALGLDAVLDEAKRLAAAEDPSAADRYAEVAESLKEAGYKPHAAIMRRHEANARELAGYPDDATIIRVRLAWDHLDAVQPWEASFALSDGQRSGAPKQVSRSIARAAKAVEAAVWVAKGATDIDNFVTAFDELTEDDQYRDRAAMFLCEEAIADDQLHLLLDRYRILDSIAHAAAECGDVSIQRCGARIQMCLADAAGNWASAFPLINRLHQRRIVAWAQARYARHLALTGNGTAAHDRYLQAIESACAEKMFNEAADWLYDLRTVRVWYGKIGLNDEEHPLAQALRAKTIANALPGSPHTAEHALDAMLDKSKPKEALYRVERWRWQAVVRGHLTHEIQAINSMGALLLREGEVDAAIECFVRAGNREDAAAAARAFPEESLRLDPSALSPVDRCRAAAYASVAAGADLIGDEEGRSWAEAALSEIANNKVDRDALRYWSKPQAFEALAALAGCLSEDQIERLLRVIEPLIDRSEQRDMRTDKAIARLLVLAARQREDAATLLARALVADQQVAQTILNEENGVLRARAAHIGAVLDVTPLENLHACMALIIAHVDSESVIAYARDRVERHLAPRKREPGRITYYSGAPEVALMTSVLESEVRNKFARTMVERAQERMEATFSRRNSLSGLLALASDLDSTTKAKLFPAVFKMACGEFDGDEADELLRRSGAINLSSAGDESITLTDLAIECAGLLAAEDSQYLAVEEVGVAILRNVQESSQWRIARALARLPVRPSELNLEHCAVHPVPAIRALAGWRWARDPSTLPAKTVLQLAKDDDCRVRLMLAHAIMDNHDMTVGKEVTEAVVSVLASDVRRSVRRRVGAS